MTGSTPSRKGWSAAGASGGEDLEEPWLVAEPPAKKHHARAAAWGASVGVGRRGHFKSFVLPLLALFVVLAVSITTRSDGSGSQPQAPPTMPPAADDTVAGDVTVSITTKSGGSGSQPQAAPTMLPAADDTVAAGDVAVSITTKSDGSGSQPQAPPTMPPAADDTVASDDVRQGNNQGECDMSSGRWVFDDAAYPLYKESACKFMSDQSACGKFGRTDLRFQQWRWQPHGCDMPMFDASKLLRELRDKRLAFVGDSLNRNQWISMVCLIDAATPTLHKSMAGGNGSSLVSFRIHEYNASVDFYWSPLLVESNSDHPVHHKIADRVVRAGSIAKHARHWADADVLVFNSYLWWRRPSMKVLWGSFEAAAEGAHRTVYEVTDGLRAFELAMKTWSEWLELHVDRARTRLFFTSMSPTHLYSDEWEADGGANHQCYNETEPIAAEAHRGRDTDPAFARAVEAAVARLGTRGVAVRVLNVTQLSELRKDAHPSVHRRQWNPPTAAELEARARDPSSGADCIHWCLPGVPDVWNQMLYAHIVAS